MLKTCFYLLLLLIFIVVYLLYRFWHHFIRKD